MNKQDAFQLLKDMMKMYDEQNDAWLQVPMTGYDIKHLLYLIYHLTSDGELSTEGDDKLS